MLKRETVDDAALLARLDLMADLCDELRQERSPWIRFAGDFKKLDLKLSTPKELKFLDRIFQVLHQFQPEQAG